ncbi:Dnaj protein-like protein [Leptomonas seymouri]|uniref:Dnaj protein-like protein n=1 Tax=Leptomonas seymouri TaxID=5684 RepID=A0A0N0P7W1_LEPSE|nr:Dnaj protein-like protein [Leptomonas seymouri]|eukprot:KPI89249.1 Dnaj protein-like protein [Leptomonas seymouri]
MGLSDIDEDEPVTHSPSLPAVLAPMSTAPAAAASTATLRNNGGNTAKINNQPNPSASSALDDLFANINISASPNSTRANASRASMSSSAGKLPSATAAAAPSVLDDLFAAPMTSSGHTVGPGGAGTPLGSGKQSCMTDTEGRAVLYVDSSGSGTVDDGTNLFDLSKRVKKDKYNNAESYLDAFERQGKKSAAPVDQSETLANLTRNKDDNKVRARLLALMSYYDVLGVAQTSSEEEIRRSYKKRALELHPDRVGTAQTQEEAELFKVITKAHEVLTDPEQRRKYDASLTAGQPMMTSANDWWNHVSM